MDTWMGRNYSPITLNKFLYADADPINGVDPSGFYTQKFGFLVEEEVENQYKQLNPHCVAQKPVARNCLFGARAYFNPTRFLKPDIMDFISKTFNEIKPLSPGGIASGKTQIMLYSAVYNNPPFNMLANTQWTPSPAIVDGTMTYFVNIDGLIFYTDDERVKREVAAASLATVAVIAKHAARKVGTRLGGAAVARAGINIALKLRSIQRILMPPAMAIQRI